MSSLPLARPSPPPLPRGQQREFEELQRAAQGSLSSAPDVHPDARTPPTAQFEGDVNPNTGEHGGPKIEPVGKWVTDGGDWSFKGRVSDF